MQHSCSDTSIEESRQSASSMTRQRDQVDFLLRSEIDNCRHYWAEQHMHVRSNLLLSQARLNSLKIIPNLFRDSVDYPWVQRGKRPCHVYCRGDRLYHLEQDHQGLDISVSKIFNVWKDCFRTFGSIQRYQDPLKHGSSFVHLLWRSPDRKE